MALFFLLILSSFASAADEPLPALHLRSVTVSGISSGAFMATQLQVALSKRIEGSGSVAGGIYGCAEGNTAKALACMLQPEKISVPDFIEKTKVLAATNAIDPVENLEKARIFLFQSPTDKVVNPISEKKLKEFFLAFLPASQMQEDVSLESAHGFPTENFGNACGQQGLPWILKCGRDVAGEILRQLYPGLQSASATTGSIRSFDQSLYAAPEATLLPAGKLYVPKECAAGSPCRLHIALHGCEMSSEFIQDQFVEEAGYNRWAEANRIVVLYPQVAKSAKNPKGCWDWFGYTGKDYAEKSGSQIQAITKMIEALTI